MCTHFLASVIRKDACHFVDKLSVCEENRARRNGYFLSLLYRIIEFDFHSNLKHFKVMIRCMNSFF